MDRLLFGLLGPTTVIGDAGEIPVQGTIRRRLLARLLVAGGRPVSIARLEEDLWDGSPPASASSTLKSHVSLLRRSLGRGRLDSRGGGYILHVEPDELDVSLFETDAQAGADLLRRGEVRLAAEAFATGSPDGGAGPSPMWPGAGWAQPEAVRIEEVRAFALDCWLEARLALGETHQIVASAEAAIAEHPLSERLWAKLMTALYRSGRQADALRAYQRLRLLLGEELGIEPSVELVELETAILRQQPALTAAAKDASREHAGNLPGDVTSFVGRARELSELAILLERPGPGHPRRARWNGEDPSRHPGRARRLGRTGRRVAVRARRGGRAGRHCQRARPGPRVRGQCRCRSDRSDRTSALYRPAASDPGQL